MPGDIVWLDSKHVVPTRGTGSHTWPHYAVCLYYFDPASNTIPNIVETGTVFRFVCISSVTKNNPFDPSRQVLLDHTDPNQGLTKPSAACVDFSPQVTVTVEDGQHVLDGVVRQTTPVVWRVPASPTLQAIQVLFGNYWSRIAAGEKGSEG
jgi:hypothetical protein